MKRKLLAVTPESTNYIGLYEVDIAHSFAEAKEMIIAAEDCGRPYDDLDLPAADEKKFWQFVDWMEKTGRRYAFSIFGIADAARFWKIAEQIREKGFHFNT